jgi:hypothetical protein
LEGSRMAGIERLTITLPSDMAAYGLFIFK